MSIVPSLAEEIRHALETAHPQLRKTISKKLPLLVAVMLEAQTANTAELAAILPLATPRGDMRLQWISRLLSNPLLASNRIIEPFARQLLAEIVENDQIILITMNQEKLGDRFVILIVNVRAGDRTFPLVWRVETETGHLGFEWQRIILEQMAAWLPEGAKVLLTVDRLPVSEGLFRWVQARGWKYRIHLQENLLVDSKDGEATALADLFLKSSTAEIPAATIRLFEGRITTNIGKWQSTDQGEPQVVAIDNSLSPAMVRGYGLYQGIDAVFAGFRSKGFSLKDTQLHYAIRIDHLVLVMSLAMYWCKQTEHHNGNCQAIRAKNVIA